MSVDEVRRVTYHGNGYDVQCDVADPCYPGGHAELLEVHRIITDDYRLIDTASPYGRTLAKVLKKQVEAETFESQQAEAAEQDRFERDASWGEAIRRANEACRERPGTNFGSVV